MKAAVFLILSLFSFTAHSQTLNLEIPSQKDFCITHFDICEKIQNYRKPNLLPDFKFKDDTLPKDRFIFYTLHVIDAWSTDRAISNGYARELNPLLPDRPSTGRIWGQKFATIGLYEYAQWLDNRTFVLTMNYVTGVAVANNLDIIIDNEY